MKANKNIEDIDKRVKIWVVIIAVIMIGLQLFLIFKPIIGNKMLSNSSEALEFDEIFYEDLSDSQVIDWYNQNYQDRGVHSKVTENERYILISAGQRNDKVKYEFKYTSLTAFQGKINLHTYLEPTEGNIEGENYPTILLRINNRDTRQVIHPQVNLMIGLEENPAKTIKDLPKEIVDFEGIYERTRLDKVELILNDGYTTNIEKLNLPKEEINLEDFNENIIVKGKFVIDRGERYLTELEEIDEIVIQGKVDGIDEDEIDDVLIIKIQDNNRRFYFKESLRSEVENLEKGSYVELTVRSVDRRIYPTKKMNLEITKITTL